MRTATALLVFGGLVGAVACGSTDDAVNALGFSSGGHGGANDDTKNGQGGAESDSLAGGGGATGLAGGMTLGAAGGPVGPTTGGAPGAGGNAPSLAPIPAECDAPGIDSTAIWPTSGFCANRIGNGAEVGPHASATLRARFDAGAAIEVPPVIDAAGHVHVATVSGHLFTLAEDLTKIADASGFGGAIHGALTVGPGGSIYLGCDDGHAYVVDDQGSPRTIDPPPTAAGTVYDAAPTFLAENALLLVRSDGRAAIVDPTQSFALTKLVMLGPPVPRAVPAFDGALAAVPLADGSVAAIDASGTVAWTATVGGTLATQPIAADGFTIGTGTGAARLDATGAITTLVLPDGSAIEGGFARPSSGPSLVGVTTDGALVVGGSTTSSLSLGVPVHAAPVADAAGFVYLGGGDGNVYAIDLGATPPAVAWTYQTDAAIVASVALDRGGTVYAASKDGSIYALAEEKPSAD